MKRLGGGVGVRRVRGALTIVLLIVVGGAMGSRADSGGERIGMPWTGVAGLQRTTAAITAAPATAEQSAAIRRRSPRSVAPLAIGVRIPVRRCDRPPSRSGRLWQERSSLWHRASPGRRCLNPGSSRRQHGCRRAFAVPRCRQRTDQGVQQDRHGRVAEHVPRWLLCLGAHSRSVHDRSRGAVRLCPEGGLSHASTPRP